MGLVGKGKTNVAGDDTELQIWGLYHLVGVTVSAFVNSTDCGDFTVAADGSITIPLWPTTASQAMKLSNLIAANGSLGESDCPVSLTSASVVNYVTIQVVVGVGFVSQGQLLRAATEADIKSRTGGALGKKRRAQQFAVLVRESQLTQFGTSLTPPALGNMYYSNFSQTPDENVTITYGNTFTGVYWAPVEDTSGYDSQFCWQQARPWPITITAVNVFLQTGEGV